LASVEARIDAIGRELQHAGAPAALDVLARLFGLSRFERDVFLLALTPELDSSFERLYGYVHDDLNRRHATAQLALTLLRPPRPGEQAARCSLLPHAPLRRYRLLVIDESPPSAAFPSRPLRVDERLLTFVLGVTPLDERVAPPLDPVPKTLIPPADGEL